MIEQTEQQAEQSKPFKLIRHMFSILAVSGSLILFLSAFGIAHISKGYILDRAEAEAISISQSLIAINHDLLLPSSSNVIDIKTILSAPLDDELRKVLAPFHIIKIKVFSPDTVIAYSTEASIIGNPNPGNPWLPKALSGFYSSSMKTKNEAIDLAFETWFDIDVVGTYAPIYNQSGDTAGSFEMAMSPLTVG